MAEEFNPNAFREQMAQQAGQIPAPVPAPTPMNAPQNSTPPQPRPAPQIQGQPQPYASPAGQAYQPQQAPQQYVPQQQPPHQAVPYQGQHAVPQGAQPAQFQPPQQQFQPQLQQTYAQPPQIQGHQASPHGNHMMPQGEAEAAKAKRSLFKRKKIDSLAMPSAPQMPQIPGQISGQMGAAMNAVPTPGGVARPIVFVAGLALGVLGMTLVNMLFSGEKSQPIKAASIVSQLPEGSTQMALTDEMLLKNKTNKNGEP